MSALERVTPEELAELREKNRKAAEKETAALRATPPIVLGKIARLEAEVARLYRELYGAGREESIDVHEHKIEGGLRFASPKTETVAHATAAAELQGHGAHELVVEVRASSVVSVELVGENVARVRVKAPQSRARVVSL